MNIKKCFHLIIIFISSINIGFSQDLNLNELINLQGKNLDYVNNYLTDKNWEFHSSKVNNNESLVNYTVVGWSFNKNSWNEKAQGWFYFYQDEGMPNIIGYQTQMPNFNRLKTAVRQNGFKLIETEAIEGGINTIYQNNQIKIIFTASKNDGEDYSYDNDIYYSVLIFNYAEIEKQNRINEKIKNQKLEEERKQQIEANLIEEKYQNLIISADSLFRLKKYSNAIKIYNDALKIKSGEPYPIEKISEANSILAFLEERKNKIFDYKDYNYVDYNSIYSIVSSKIKNTLTNKNVSGSASFSIIYIVDTIGQTTVSLNDKNSSNLEILNLIKPIINDVFLKPVSKDGYSVFAKAEYDFDILMDDRIIKLKKNNVETITYNNPANLYKSEISNLISSGPIGKYKIQIQNRTINNIDFSKNTIIKYRGIGGPSNLFLSILVPGLGDKNVTGGRNSGLGTALWSYGFILSGIGCKAWSNSEYDQYHKALNQTSMDDHYFAANMLNKSFYILTALGATIWVYDIIWVASKGFKNRKVQKLYKQNFSFYYEQKNQALGLSYKFKF